MNISFLVQCRSQSGDVVAWFKVSQKHGVTLDDTPLFQYCIIKGIPGEKWTFQIVAKLSEVDSSSSHYHPTLSSTNADIWFLGINIPNF